MSQSPSLKSYALYHITRLKAAYGQMAMQLPPFLRFVFTSRPMMALADSQDVFTARTHYPLDIIGDLDAVILADIERLSPLPRHAALFRWHILGLDRDKGLDIEIILLRLRTPEQQALVLHEGRFTAFGKSPPFSPWPLLAILMLLSALTITPLKLQWAVDQNDRALRAAMDNFDMASTSQPVTRLKALQESLAKTQNAPSAIALLEGLSHHIPQNAWITNLNFEKDTLDLTGHAPSAADVVKALSAAPFVTDVATLGATHSEGDVERFTVRLHVKGGTI